MTETQNILSGLSRPRLLIRAARFGLGDYRRERDLKRLIRNAPQEPEKMLPRLIDEEQRLETNRRSGDLAYSLTRHIDVMVALMFEARLLRSNVGT